MTDQPATAAHVPPMANGANCLYRPEAPVVQGELSGRILLLDPVTFRPVFGMTIREARSLVRAIQAEMRDLREA